MWVWIENTIPRTFYIEETFYLRNSLMVIGCAVVCCPRYLRPLNVSDHFPCSSWKIYCNSVV
jgi:hypothetical protein